MAPPEGIIRVVLPGFKVPAVHAVWGTSGDAVGLSTAGGASAAAPPLPVDIPASITPDEPPLSDPPLPAGEDPPLSLGATLPPLADAPPEPEDTAASAPPPAPRLEQPAYKRTPTVIPIQPKTVVVLSIDV
jgi:hypothetical protein